MYSMYCTVVASSSAVSDPAGARRLGNASIGMSIAGIIVLVVVVIIIVVVATSSCPYSYHGTCYTHRKDIDSYYDYCPGVRDYYEGYCYYDSY